jgi:L-threonate 2-dehydrogenase
VTTGKTSENSVGLIGLGIMGSAMSTHLIAAATDTFGYDTNGQALDNFSKVGGSACASVSEVAENATILITSLPAPEALHSVVEELCSSRPQSGKNYVVVETSTFTLKDKFLARERLAEAGIAMLDCPLSGSGSQARVRDVLVYGSGDREIYDRCLPVFDVFSRAPHYVGEFGNGSKMKYVANLLVAIHTVAAGEAFALARKVGLDPAQMFEVVVDGAGGSRAMQVRGNMLIADRYLPIETMPLSLWRKDVAIITEFVNSFNFPAPLFGAAATMFNAAVASGYEDQDTAAVCLVSENLAGRNDRDR